MNVLYSTTPLDLFDRAPVFNFLFVYLLVTLRDHCCSVCRCNDQAVDSLNTAIKNIHRTVPAPVGLPVSRIFSCLGDWTPSIKTRRVRASYQRSSFLS